MRTATEILGDGVPRCERWTATCLPCDSTWIGSPAQHRCQWRQDYRRNFWIRRIQWALLSKLPPDAMPDQSALHAEAIAIVDSPLTRDRMAELLGDRWRVANDPVLRMPKRPALEAA